MSKSYPIMQCGFQDFPRISAESLFGVARIESLHAWLNIRQSLQDCQISLAPSYWVRNKTVHWTKVVRQTDRHTHTHTNAHTQTRTHIHNTHGKNCFIISPFLIKHLFFIKIAECLSGISLTIFPTTTIISSSSSSSLSSSNNLYHYHHHQHEVHMNPMCYLNT